MARLIVHLNDQFLREVPLSRETITIGRKQGNDIHLDNHAVSGYHAQIITLLNDSFVEDLGSTNGTVVNDLPVRKRALQEGDEIGIYHYRIVYTRKAGTTRPMTSGQADRTVIIRMDALGLPSDNASNKIEAAVQQIDRSANTVRSATTPGIRADIPQTRSGLPDSLAAPAAPAPAETMPEAGNAPRQPGRLHILSGPNSGRILELVKPLTTLGRPGLQVAAIQRRGPGYIIIHVDGGASGESPRVNDRHIGTASRALENGDIIHIAGVRMEFRH